MSKFNTTPKITLNRRRLINASLLILGLAASGCAHFETEKRLKILFVCQAGTAKSAIAREIFKARAKERGVEVDVISRGLKIEDHLSPELKRKLIADGINTNAEPALQIAPSDWANTDILVYFNPLPMAITVTDMRDWSDVPSVNEDYTNARSVLDSRIDALLSEITNRSAKR